MTLSVERLREKLDYDPATGVFTLRDSRHKTLRGKVVGSPHLYWLNGESVPSGYTVLHIDRRLYLAHRLAWMYVYGEMPRFEVDHIDGDRGNNCISNLRVATRTQNAQNSRKLRTSASGVKGVRRSRCGSKWVANLFLSGREKYLGTYPSVEEAAEVVQLVREMVHGEFARHV